MRGGVCLDATARSRKARILIDLHITFQRWYPSLSPSRKDKIRRLGLVSAAS
jgi:hypothetical protein